MRRYGTQGKPAGDGRWWDELRLWKFAGLANDMVFALDHAPWIRARRDVAEPDVVRNRTEEGDAFADEYR